MSTTSGRKAIVHLIDDDAAIRASTELLFKTAGIDVQVYSSGIEFLSDLNPDEIRCLVIDVSMSGINGIDLLDRLRRSGIMAPAIFTGYANTPDVREAAARTGAAVLIKPYRPEELITRVKNALDKEPN